MRISDWSSDVCSSDLRGDGDQPVGGLFDRLAREAVVDDVVERDAAPAMDRLIEFLARAERGDRDRHLPLGAGRDVRLEPAVRFMDDLVDRIGRREAVGIVAVPRGERSEEHTSELQSLMRISYAVFCLKKKNKIEQI